MAATQVGTGSLTINDPQTGAATYISVPAGSIVESVTTNYGGTPQMETQYDSLGAFHTDIWFEKRQDEITVVIVGKDYAKVAVGQTDVSGYEVMKIEKQDSKGPVRTTVTVKKITFS